MDFGLFGIGMWELMVIGLLALIILGPRQMIVLARRAGELLRQFQQIWNEASRTIDRELKAIESEAGELKDLTRKIESLTQDVKSALTLNPPGNGNAPTIAPPAPQPNRSVATPSTPPVPLPTGSSSPTPPAPDPETAAPTGPSANSTSTSTRLPDHPTTGLSDHSTKYPAWTNKPKD